MQDLGTGCEVLGTVGRLGSIANENWSWEAVQCGSDHEHGAHAPLEHRETWNP